MFCRSSLDDIDVAIDNNDIIISPLYFDEDVETLAGYQADCSDNIQFIVPRNFHGDEIMYFNITDAVNNTLIMRFAIHIYAIDTRPFINSLEYDDNANIISSSELTVDILNPTEDDNSAEYSLSIELQIMDLDSDQLYFVIHTNEKIDEDQIALQAVFTNDNNNATIENQLSNRIHSFNLNDNQVYNFSNYDFEINNLTSINEVFKQDYSFESYIEFLFYPRDNGGFDQKSIYFNIFDSYSSASNYSLNHNCNEDICPNKYQLQLNLIPNCAIGTYLNIWSLGTVCKLCPDGAECDANGNFLPVNDPGYILLDNETYTFIQCSPAESCPGYDNQCATNLGYTGDFCGSCIANYYKSDVYCKPCPNNDYLIYIYGAIGLILLTVLLIFLATKGKFVFKISGVVMTFFQTIVEFSFIELEWTKKMKDIFQYFTIFNFDIDLLSVECQLDPNDTSAEKYRTKFLGFLFFPIIIALLLLFVYLFSVFIKLIISKCKKSRIPALEDVLLRAFTIFAAFAFFL